MDAEVETEVFTQFQLYAKLTRQPVNKVINRALREWWLVNGEVLMETRTGLPATEIEIDGHRPVRKEPYAINCSRTRPATS